MREWVDIFLVRNKRLRDSVVILLPLPYKSTLDKCPAVRLDFIISSTAVQVTNNYLYKLMYQLFIKVTFLLVDDHIWYVI